MSNFTFTADSITVAGKTYPAAYSITKTGAVMAFVTIPGTEEVQRVRFPADHPDHAAALVAAQAEKAAHAAEAERDAETTTQEPAAETVQETTTEAPAPAVVILTPEQFEELAERSALTPEEFAAALAA